MKQKPSQRLQLGSKKVYTRARFLYVEQPPSAWLRRSYDRQHIVRGLLCVGTCLFYLECPVRDIQGKEASSVWNLLSLVQPLACQTNSYQVLRYVPPHIREVKCNVSLQIHSYSKHEANALARKTEGQAEETKV